MMRRQLPVSSPVDPRALVRAIPPALAKRQLYHRQVAATISEMFGACGVLLTDRGTSALVLALRLAVGKGGTVAFPGYACVDLAAAARYAGVRVRLYDLDPSTLSPDLDSVARVLERGVNAVLVAHLYGYPADVPGVAALASDHGVPVIEDAAQGAAGTLDGRPLGGFGALSVLSFGRGKGMTGGNGGALLAIAPEWEEAVSELAGTLQSVRAGWTDLAGAAAQWAFGRPSLYGIPSAVPALRLGEMVYHPAHEPATLSNAAAALLCSAIPASAREGLARRRNAEALEQAIVGGTAIAPIRAIPGGMSGYLRLAVLDWGERAPAPDLGIFRGYPRTLAEQEELRPALCSGEPPTLGATELRASLFTVPTHGRVSAEDLSRLGAWLSDRASVTN